MIQVSGIEGKDRGGNCGGEFGASAFVSDEPQKRDHRDGEYQRDDSGDGMWIEATGKAADSDQDGVNRGEPNLRLARRIEIVAG